VVLGLQILINLQLANPHNMDESLYHTTLLVGFIDINCN